MITNPIQEKISVLDIAQLDAATIDKINQEAAHDKFIELLEHLIYMELITKPEDFDRLDDDLRNKLMGHFMVAYHNPYERNQKTIDNRDVYGEYKNFYCTNVLIERMIGKISEKEFAQDICNAACNYYARPIKLVIEEYFIHNGYAGFQTDVEAYKADQMLDDPRRGLASELRLTGEF